MRSFLFSLLALEYGFLTLFFFYRFVRYRRLPSLVCAVLPVGWVLLMLREMKVLPRDATSVFISLGLVVGALSCLVILYYESQQERPFQR